jgi:molybdate transport repressor ModE-like protein
METWISVEVRHLSALLAVAEERSFRRAARRLGYTQSAISGQIAALERIVGARLVERSRGTAHVALTPAGDVLVRHAERVTAQLTEARAELKAVRDAGRLL